MNSSPYFFKSESPLEPPADATTDSISWYAADGSKIGPTIWGEFAIIQEVSNDTGTGDHGILYLSPYSAGLGRFSPKD